MPDRGSVLQAGVLLFTLTVELTQAAVETLGAGNSGNRQVQILLALHTRSGLTPSRLAESLGISRSSMSHALARFEAEDLIDRSVDNEGPALDAPRAQPEGPCPPESLRAGAGNGAAGSGR